MASEMPRYIMRNCMLWVDKTSRIGQCHEVQLPELKMKTEEMRNAGMIRAKEINLGRDKMDCKFKEASLDPALLKLFGLAIGKHTPLMVTGALVDEDGTVHSAVAHLEGFLKSMKIDSWKPGDKKNDNDYDMAVHYFKLEIDGELILEETLWEKDGIARALLI
jgi:uncharacterized protein